ncbi:nucleic acid-binding protein [Armillaria gallica]|uniref:Nucleic acid-binding protein n=1 Tax=Armillaria gallica TaxID=47427 RepID=A0A2H3EN95_ARMGA|nr:nucleic acid-binding protein [Armillaria gallica]
MFSAIRSSGVSRASIRAFSTSRPSRTDMAKLVLIGNLGGDPETRSGKNDVPFVTYTVATQQYVPPPPDSQERPTSKTTWHRVFCFHENTNKYLSTLRKGSKVYVEAAFEMRENHVEGQDAPQRNVFLKHESIKVISPPKQQTHEESHESHE